MRMRALVAFSCVCLLTLVAQVSAGLQVLDATNGLIHHGFCNPDRDNGTDFGEVDVATGVVFQTYVLSNAGPSSVSLSGITNIEDAVCSFTILNGYTNSILNGGNTLEVPVRFTPSTNGLIQSTLFVVHDDSATNSPYSFLVQGSGRAGALSVFTTNGLAITNREQSTSTQFRSTPVNYGEAVRSFVMSNSGAGTLLVTNVVLSPTGCFSVASYNAGALSTGETGFLTFSFDPSTAGLFDATARIYHASSCGHPFELVLSGTATKPGLILLGTNLVPIVSGDLTTSPDDGSRFEDLSAQHLLSTHSFLITNEGDSVISISGITFEGADAAEFSCTDLSETTLGSGEQTALPISFAPTNAGSFYASVLIHSSDPSSPHTYALFGRAEPHCEIYGGSNSYPIANGTGVPTPDNNTDFGALSAGSITKTFFITNSGAASLQLTNTPSISLTGINTNGFEITAWPSASLAAGDVTSFAIKFTPVSPSARTVSVVVANNDLYHTNSAFSFNICGSGVYSNILVDTDMGLPDLANGQACWGDYDNDGFVDLLLSGRNTNGLFTGLFHNEGGLSFSNISVDLPAVESSRADWGDYDRDGDVDLVFCGFQTNGLPGTYLLRNDGTGVFTLVETVFAAVYSGGVRWGDYDNDGLLDLALCGFCDVSSNVTFVYRNQGDGTFTNSNISFTGVRDGSIDWADYDNDGWLDLLVSGDSSGGKVTRLYRNNGTTFTNSGVSLPGCALGRSRWVDFDCDGDMDLSFSGYGQSAPLTRLYRYIGGSSPFFRIDTNQLSGCWLGDSAWGDYDSDGDPDLLVSGIGTNGTFISDLYYNDGYGNLNHTGLPVPPLKQSVVSWADMNSDGIVDLLLSGRDTNGIYTTKTYLNSAPISNTPPRSPRNLQAVITNGYELNLSWDAAEDNQTPSDGLSYALYIGTSSNSANLRTPMADLTTGQRLLIRPVNHTKRLTYHLPYIPASSNFYWGVQAIDSCDAGGEFAHGEVVSRSPLPDFAVCDLSYLSTPFTIYATITNRGAVSGDAGILAVWLNSPAPEQGSTNADSVITAGILAAGESRMITFSNFPAADAIVTNTIRAFINADGSTPEETLTNNQFTVQHITTVVDDFWFRAFGMQDSNWLRWPNPLDCGLLSDRVYLRFSTSGYPADLTDGFLLYEGTNRVYHHTGLTPSQAYYYTIWVSNDGTNFIAPPASGSQ